MKRLSGKKRKGFSLTFKISVTITLLITVLMFGMGTMTYLMNTRVLINQETSQGRSIGHLAGQLMAPQMAANDRAALISSIASLKEDPKVVQAYVTDAEGEVVAHEQRESIGNRMQSRALATAMETGRLQVQQTQSDSGGMPVLLFVAPLHNSLGETTGYLHYMTDFSPAQDFLTDSATQWIKVFVGVVLAALVIVRIIIVRAVGKPVKQLMAAAERAAVGDFSQELEPGSQDELGQLAEGFNLMNKQLGVLFRSIHQTVSEMDYATRQIVSRSQTLSEIDASWTVERQQEWVKEILSNGKRLVRVTDKLQAFLNQFQVKDDLP